jgi:inosine-uridine nucleoside N-ribohydrolase
MKSKALRTILIVVGVLGLLIILIWPATPLWARLGLKPVCIQNNQGKIKVVACPDTSPPKATATPIPLPTPGALGSIPVIVDDDGSPDGVIALLYFLRHPDYDVKAVTVSVGEAHPQLFADNLARLLAGLGRTDIPVGYGSDQPLAGTNAFPQPWRAASDDFWGVPLTGGGAPVEPQPGVPLMVSTLMNSDEQVLIFVSGTHTNLAEALRQEPAIAGHIRDVYIMGGSLDVPGNIESDWPEIHNRVAEWNIWVDPQAASEVFASGLPLHLVPLDATDQVTWSEADARTWQAYDNPESDLAAELVRTLLASWSTSKLYIWDLVAAVSATDGRLCPWTPLAVDVITAGGEEQGRTIVTSGPANIDACLDPDVAQIKLRVENIFNSDR